MPDASFVQPSFTGGEWSAYAQGRIDDKRYRTAMETCSNGVPVEEGAWVRRPGSAFMATTRNGVYGRVLPFDFSDVTPFNMEFTDSHLRLLAGRSLVFDTFISVVDVSSDATSIVTTLGAHGWSTGNQVQFLFQSVPTASNGAILRNRVLAITVLNANQFTLADPITGAAVNGTLVNWSGATAQVARVLDLSTPYTISDIPTLRRIVASGVGANNSDVAVLLNGKHMPQAVTGIASATAPTFSSFTISPLAFVDGPLAMDLCRAAQC